MFNHVLYYEYLRYGSVPQTIFHFCVILVMDVFLSITKITRCKAKAAQARENYTLAMT